MVVRYQPEDAAGVDPTSSDALRFAATTANRYPKRFLYGNAAPLAEDDDTSTAEWYFEAVLDYGDHDTASPQPTPDTTWPVRQDPAFSGRMGFEVRTRRLCRRVLMFHHFPSELGEASTLVGSLELDLAEAPDATTLNGVRYVGWRTEGGARVSQATPWATFTYTDTGQEDAFTVLEAPLLGAHTQLLDLFSEGLPGLLTADPSGIRYAENLGDGAFGGHQLLPAWPVGVAGGTLADFDGDGNVELVALSGPGAGYYRLDRRSRTWEPLRYFAEALNTQHGVVRQADLSGDGRPDIVLFHEDGVTWLPNQGAAGFGEPIEVRLPAEKMPAASGPLDRFLADMTGDGLADIVEVLNGSVRYWPNLGRGRFGDPVVMDGAPRLDCQGSYDAARVLFVDTDSTGSADLLYLRGDGTLLRASNERGTGFGALTAIAWGAPVPNGAGVQLTDLYGDGSRCLVWTGPSDAGAASFHALRLTSSPGARQMQEVTHPLGATSTLEWGHSVRHYLRDVASGRGWDTPLPSQRPVIDALSHTEPIDGQTKSERYAYHDGHYDPRERSFVLFAVVEHLDVDVQSGVIDVVPLLTRRFSHTGEYDYASRFARHHYARDLEARPPPSWVEDAALLEPDFEEAFRALMGSPVRQEVYGTDGQGVPGADPFTVAATGRLVRLTRAADTQYRTAVQVIEQDAVESVYEESAADPCDPRETLKRTLDVDAYLTPLTTFVAGLPRRASATFAAQASLLATASRGSVVHIDTQDRFELAIPVEQHAYEVHVPSVDDAYADTLASDLSPVLDSAVAYDQSLDPAGTSLAARELTHERVYYWDDTLSVALTLGSTGAITLPHHSEQATYDRGQLTSVFGTRIDPDADLPSLGFAVDVDVFYAQGPTTHFAAAADFHRLTQTEAFDGGVQSIVADAYHLCAQQASDEVGNTSVAAIDYHVLAPWQLTDPNGTVQEIDYDPLGVARRTSRYGTAMDGTGAMVAHGFAALTLGQARPTIDDALADPLTALGTAEHLIAYEFPGGGAPMRTLTLAAEEFVDRGPDAGSAAARAQVGVRYLDGFGRALQERTLVDPGTAWTVDPGTGALVEASVSERWLVSGYTVFDEKQQPTQQYEPLFRDAPDFDADVAHRQMGVNPTTALRRDGPDDSAGSAERDLQRERVHAVVAQRVGPERHRLGRDRLRVGAERPRDRRPGVHRSRASAVERGHADHGAPGPAGSTDRVGRGHRVGARAHRAGEPRHPGLVSGDDRSARPDREHPRVRPDGPCAARDVDGRGAAPRALRREGPGDEALARGHRGAAGLRPGGPADRASRDRQRHELAGGGDHLR